MDLNQNFNQCIQSVENFGHKTFTNICTGQVTDVPWGFMDWIGHGLGLAFLGVLVVFCIGAVIALISES